MLFVTILNHVVKPINEKRGAIFDIYLQRKKESKKYCVKFFDSFSKKVCAGTTQFFSSDSFSRIIFTKTLFESVIILCV